MAQGCREEGVGIGRYRLMAREKWRGDPWQGATGFLRHGRAPVSRPPRGAWSWTSCPGTVAPVDQSRRGGAAIPRHTGTPLYRAFLTTVCHCLLASSAE